MNDVYSGNYDCYGNIYDKKYDKKISMTSKVKYCMVGEKNIAIGQILKNQIAEIKEDFIVDKILHRDYMEWKLY